MKGEEFCLRSIAGYVPYRVKHYTREVTHHDVARTEPGCAEGRGKGLVGAPAAKTRRQHVGLYWNFKAGGDAALKHAGELLRSRYAGVETKLYVGSIGGSNHFLTKDDAKRIAGECVGMIGSTAD